MRHELVSSRHVDTVNVLIAQGGSCAGHVHLARTCFPSQLDDLRNRRASHNGIVNQEHVLVFEFKINGVEFLAHRIPALFLSRHDKGPADVAVFDETFAILGPQLMG